MSLLSWLRNSRKNAERALPESSGLSRVEPTRPARRGDAMGGNAQPANRKHERMARREQLYGVVREAMVRAGVLSSSYKFKVLSLDARGRQFLVMVDLAADSGVNVSHLSEIEALIAQASKSRHDIVVTSVYWRTSAHVAIGDPVAQRAQAQLGAAARPGSPSTPHAEHPRAEESQPEHSQPAALDSAPTPLEPQAAARSHFEPISAEEVAAFKRALATGADPAGPAGPRARVAAAASAPATAAAAAAGASAVAFDGSSRHGPQSYTLLTGFEDTEVTGDETARAPILSGTQYGDLR